MKIPIATNADSEGWGEHDPEAAMANHDPEREPWASMTRDQLMEAQGNAKTAAEHDMLQEFIEDGMTSKELQTMTRAHVLAAFLMKQWDASGNAQCVFLCGLAGRVAKEIADSMPAMGPPQECN